MNTPTQKKQKEAQKYMSQAAKLVLQTRDMIKSGNVNTATVRGSEASTKLHDAMIALVEWGDLMSK